MSKKLGKYEILDEIGRGGFAVVYKAYDTERSRVVALKVLAPHLVWDVTFAERFRAEFDTIAKLHHPNIVSVYEYDEIDGQPYIAMEYIYGMTLAQLLRQTGGPLPPERVLYLTQQLASALTHALRRGVIHRDIKPSNIMVNAEDKVKLTDFGIAKVTARTFQTTTGRIFGSPEYMSPEQAQGKELDHRSDVYALGVVLYEMLTGKVPFSSDTPLSTMLSHCEKEPPRPSQLNQALPLPVETVVLKALTKSRTDRFQSSGELAHYLRQAVNADSTLAIPTIQTTKPKPKPESPPPPKPGRSFNWRDWQGIPLLLIGLMILAILAISLRNWWLSVPAATPIPTIPIAQLPTNTPTATPVPATETSVPTATETAVPTTTLLPTSTQTPALTQTPLVIVQTIVTTPTPLPPTSTNTPTPMPTWALVYDEYFNTEDRIISQNEYRTRHILNEEMVIDIYETDYLSRHMPANEAKCQTCQIELLARFIGGAETFYYGIVFRFTEGGYFTFEIGWDGRYRVRKRDGEVWTTIQEWQDASQIYRGTQTNWLAIQVVDDRLYVYINDRGRAVNAGDPITGIDLVEGYAGFFAASGDHTTVSIAFDNFVVKKRP